MALSPPQQAEWDAWLADRPDCIREAGKKLVPWKLYYDRESGMRCTLVGFTEVKPPDQPRKAEVIADFTGRYNLISFNRRVHGLSVDQLEECDLPAENEPLGVMLNNEQRLAYINEQRATHGLGPLTEEQLQRLSGVENNPNPTCVMEVQPDGEDQGKGQEEGRQEESSKGEGEAAQASTEAVQAQEAGPADDCTPD